MTLSDAQIAALARQAGCIGPAVTTAVAVALAESEGDPTAVHTNSDGSRDDGLWQINSVHGYDPTRLHDPTYNAQAMFRISSGGINWMPWATFTSGAYRQYLDRARAASSVVSAPGVQLAGWQDWLNPLSPGFTGGKGLPGTPSLPDLHISNPLDIAGAIVKSFKTFSSIFGKLTDSKLWLRIGQGVAAMLLLVLALALIFRKQVASVGKVAAL